jgi:steroid delta-isomerase-like uncharacterized protein
MDLKTTLQSFINEVWNNGDFTNLGDYVARTYKIKHDPGDLWEGQILDADEFKVRVMYSRNAFPDLHFDLQEMISETDKVTVRWTMSGTHQGDLPHLPATGKPFSITGMTFYYFDGSKLCGHSQTFDQLAFLSQIGAFGIQ